jgi:hypothetical protein
MKTELKYRTFDELLNEVRTDFVMLDTENMIEPAQMIKVAQRVNYDLGLRINGTKEVVLQLEKRRVKLPDDFYVANFAYLCEEGQITSPVISGRQTENVILERTGPDCSRCGNAAVDKCSCTGTYVNECQNGERIAVQVIEKKLTETKIYKRFHKFEFAPDRGRRDALEVDYPVGYIQNGFIYSNIECGNLFLSYQGGLEDENGNLLVLDHPLINEYYEYAIKQRLLENLYMNGEDVAQRMQLVEQRLRAARNNALSIVNTPDFAEMYQLWWTNRKAQYGKYYDMFKSYTLPTYFNPGFYNRL